MTCYERMEECDALDLDLDTSAIEAGTVLYKCRECAKVIWRPGTCLGINTARTTSGAGVDGGQ